MDVRLKQGLPSTIFQIIVDKIEGKDNNIINPFIGGG